jgi:hypothetical protein
VVNDVVVELHFASFFVKSAISFDDDFVLLDTPTATAAVFPADDKALLTDLNIFFFFAII